MSKWLTEKGLTKLCIVFEGPISILRFFPMKDIETSTRWLARDTWWKITPDHLSKERMTSQYTAVCVHDIKNSVFNSSSQAC